MARRFRYAALLLLTCVLGLGVRFAGLGLPHAIRKYGGSALWAMAIFWLIALVVPRRTIVFRTGMALLLAFAIEFFKLVRTPALDRFRLTLPGKFLLGRFFSARDLLAYLVAILLAAALDRAISRSRHSTTK